MANEPKTRIVVKTEKGIVHLFSIHERSDGDLQIFLVHDVDYDDPERGNVKIDTEKISLHPSHNSHGTTITHRKNLDDGRRLTASSFVAYSKTGLLFPFFGRTLPSVQGATRKIRPRDKTVVLTEFDSRRSTFAFIGFVCSLDVTPPSYPHDVGNLLVLDFSYFRLAIYFAFINFGTMPFSTSLIMATSPRQSEPDTKPPTGVGCLSYTPHDAQLFIDHAMDGMWRRYHAYIAPFADAAGEDAVRELKRHASMVLKRPYVELPKVNGVAIIHQHFIGPGEAFGTLLSIAGKMVGKLYLDPPTADPPQTPPA